MRTVRLPEASQGDGRQRALLGEIRRTLAAARQQLGERQVEHVVVSGNQAVAGNVSGLSEELGLPVTNFDPADAAPAGLKLQNIATDSLARFAAVLGMALGESDRRPPIVDFANVRRRVEARKFTRTHALIGAAAAIAAIAFLGHLWINSARSANELANIRSEIESLKQSKKQYEKVVANAAAIERWLATDVNWLDEVEELGRRVRPKTFSEQEYPVNEDVVVTQLTLGRPAERGASGGRINLQAVGKTDSAMPKLESRLRDERHRVEGGGVQQDDSVPGYQWQFGVRIDVAKAEDESAGAN